MKNAARVSVLFVSLCAIASCGGGLLVQMDRVITDPTLQAPRVTSFIIENRIDVSWDPDKAADLYVLERAQDAINPNFSTVYQGTNISYAETALSDQSRYLYRLSKIRGGKLFGPSDAVLGVCSATSRDILEPNDSESQASTLVFKLGANLYYYNSAYQQNGTPSIFQDEDWYAVNVLPHHIANIVVTQDNLGSLQNTNMYFYTKGQSLVQIVNDDPLPITNHSDTTAATFLFKISPIPNTFPAGGGGSLITYTVWLYSTTSY
ncbi:MAG: hypothetical protein ABSG63_11150 [Spirochaetia bacterium]|jgi:hypothetical protein